MGSRATNPSSQDLTCKQVSEVVRFPGRRLASELDGSLIRCRSDKVQSEVSDDGHVSGAKALSKSRLIFVERDVEHPVQPVVSRPEELLTIRPSPDGSPFFSVLPDRFKVRPHQARGVLACRPPRPLKAAILLCALGAMMRVPAMIANLNGPCSSRRKIFCVRSGALQIARRKAYQRDEFLLGSVTPEGQTALGQLAS